MLVGCYVDDLLVTGTDTNMIIEFKKDIAKRFTISDMNEVKWILGMEVERDCSAKTLTLHQRKYINDILELFGMTKCNARTTPADPSVRLTKDDPNGVQMPRSIRCNRRSG